MTETERPAEEFGGAFSIGATCSEGLLSATAGIAGDGEGLTGRFPADGFFYELYERSAAARAEDVTLLRRRFFQREVQITDIALIR
jgi:hypothetical protein